MQNLDTDLQYGYLAGIRDYVLEKKDYLLKQVGNPEGPVCVISSLQSPPLIPRYRTSPTRSTMILGSGFARARRQ